MKKSEEKTSCDASGFFSELDNLILKKEYSSVESRLLNSSFSFARDESRRLFYLGVVRYRLGDFSSAKNHLLESWGVEKDHMDPVYMLAKILFRMGDFSKAEKYIDFCIANQFKDPKVYLLRGLLHDALGNFVAAADDFAKAIELDPDYGDAYFNLASNCIKQRCYEQAISLFNKAFELSPENHSALANELYWRRHLCDWGEEKARLSEIKKLGVSKGAVSPFSMITFDDSPERAKKRSERFWQAQFGQIKRTHFNIPNNAKVRVGYFSADFFDHATSHLLMGVLEKHDRSIFEVFLYSFGVDKKDPINSRLRSIADEYIDLHSLSDASAVELIRRDNLAIAFDLKGFTTHCRPSLFAYGIAPIQINYLGYPGTLGSDAYDYIVCDKHLITPSMEKYFSERLLTLDGCYQPNQAAFKLPACGTRADYGLPMGAIVLCSFNSPYKISPDIFNIWMDVLIAVPEAVLWIYAPLPESRGNLLREVELRGLDSKKIIFAEKVDHDIHVSRMQLADLFVDTFPVSAHTTCSDALRAGLPIVTLAGRSFHSRVAASILHSCGLDQLVTKSPQDYKNTIVKLTGDQHELRTLKIKLSNAVAKSGLFDNANYTLRLEMVLARLVRKDQFVRDKGSCLTLKGNDFFDDLASSKHGTFEVILRPATGGQHDVGNDRISVWSSYFNALPDPQRGISWPPNDFSLISNWYNSIRLFGVTGLIFYDRLSNEFVEHYTTPSIAFEKCNVHKWSINDFRFQAYFDAISTLNSNDILFLTDISDVELINPRIFKEIDDSSLYIGKDMFETPKIKNNTWMIQKTKTFLNEARSFNFDKNFWNAELYNAGVIGGKVSVMRDFLTDVLDILNKQVGVKNHNMFAVNYAIHKNWSNRIGGKNISVTSQFKKNEDRRTDVLFKHK